MNINPDVTEHGAVLARLNKEHFMGWTIYGANEIWAAFRHGVRMRANSETLIKRMILRKCEDERIMERNGGFWATLFNPSLR